MKKPRSLAERIPKDICLSTETTVVSTNPVEFTLSRAPVYFRDSLSTSNLLSIFFFNFLHCKISFYFRINKLIFSQIEYINKLHYIKNIDNNNLLQFIIIILKFI